MDCPRQIGSVRWKGIEILIVLRVVELLYTRRLTENVQMQGIRNPEE